MANIRLTAPACRGGKVCSFVSNDGNENAQVTVTFNVGGTNYPCNVTVPPQDSKDCCVSPAETGLCSVTVSAPGATPRTAQLVLPCR
jgi:hypothetical protein